MPLLRSSERHRAAVWTILAISICIATARVQADPSRLVVTFSGAEVVITGGTPRGQIALIGLAREPMGYYTEVKSFCELLDVDGDGKVVFDTKSTGTWKSIWGVVDLRTGDHLVASPERSPGKEIGFRGKGLGKGADGKLSKLEHEGEWLELLLVKPTGDVYRAIVVDGGPMDEDGVGDRIVHPSLDAFEIARGKGGKPDEYRNGDVLFAIDVNKLTMVAVRVK